MEPPLSLNGLHSILGAAAFTNQGTTVMIIILLLLLFISFSAAGSEVAFFSLTYKDINLLKTKQQHAYKRVIDLLENPKVLLASLQIAKVTVNIFIIVIANYPHQFHFVQFSQAGDFLVKFLSDRFCPSLSCFAKCLPKTIRQLSQYPFCERLRLYNRSDCISCLTALETGWYKVRKRGYGKKARR